MAQYPTAAGTDANLFVAVNNLSCSLSDNPLTSGATTINVSSTTGFPTAGFVTIDAECIQYTGTTGTTFTGCTRGAAGTAAASHVNASQVLHTVVADHHNVLKDEIKAIEGDLVGVMASITPTSPANTATSILNRWAQLAQQLKNIAGTTNWYDAITKNLTQLLPLSGGTMSGDIDANHNRVKNVKGTATNDAATAGDIGEYVSLVNTFPNNFPATTTWGDGTSISLTAGDWLLTAVIYADVKATTTTDIAFGITPNSGATSAGMVNGDNNLILAGPVGSASQITGGTISGYRVSIASTTTYYLKIRAIYSGTTPQFGCRLSATRIR